MKFDIYGHFILEVVRKNDQWIAYRSGEGTRRRENNLVIPADLDPSELASYLDDIYHELCREGQNIRELG